MSYMDTHAAFAPAGGIQELSFDEIEEVGGGIVPFLPAIGAFLSSPAGIATIASAGAIATAAIAYVTSTRSDDCTTINKYDSKGRLGPVDKFTHPQAD